MEAGENGAPVREDAATIPTGRVHSSTAGSGEGLGCEASHSSRRQARILRQLSHACMCGRSSTGAHVSLRLDSPLAIGKPWSE
jgi:hypothetical protein